MVKVITLDMKYNIPSIFFHLKKILKIKTNSKIFKYMILNICRKMHYKNELLSVWNTNKLAKNYNKLINAKSY